MFWLLYVEDILIVNQYKDELEEIKGKLSSEFEMKHLGSVRHIVGMNIYIYIYIYICGPDGWDIVFVSTRVRTPLLHHTKLSVVHAPSTKKERRMMKNTSYANGVGSMMQIGSGSCF